ncbi:MAG: nucleotide-binding universal stress UspA family protein [Myxococcota bacterium]
MALLVGARFGDTYLAQQEAERMTDAKTLAGQLAERARQSGVRASTFVTRAERVAPAIVKRADDMNASVIIMPAHSYDGLTRTVLGSVTEEVIRRTSRPVLMRKPTRA